MNSNRYMSNTNYDTYVIVCNGGQHSSSTCDRLCNTILLPLCAMLRPSSGGQATVLVPGVLRGAHREGRAGAAKLTNS